LYALLFFHAVLVFFSMRRGWRVLPFAVLALPHVFAGIVSQLPALAVGGWIVPVTNLVMAVGGLCTCSLLYTSIADPEPA
jgi:hypothetical protein